MLVTALGVLSLVLGTVIAWYALRSLVVVPKLLRADVTPPADIEPDNSFVVCRGTATATDDAVASPFTGTRCVGFEFAVSERQPGPLPPWFVASIDDGVSSIPFRLSGQAGDIDVNPPSRRFSLDTNATVIKAGSNETPPKRTQQFVEKHDRLNPVAGWISMIPGMGTRRYVERRIDPNEEYLIAGQTAQRNGKTELTGNLVITNKSLRQFVLSRLKRAAFPALVATFFVAVGGALLLV
ncbi:hypothetical protein ACFQJ7_14755 [Halovenus rubra]|uniref:RING-type E3 ubiquitin transferase n=2 Tax=Halovenus rubra TaxID=869890 RepID=A0ABD5X7S2_9EURY|nr:hypothetical protein [Halovenus rubra]